MIRLFFGFLGNWADMQAASTERLHIVKQFGSVGSHRLILVYSDFLSTLPYQNRLTINDLDTLP